MAKKKKNSDNIDSLGLGTDGEKKENKVVSTAITIVIVLIWLGIIAILIKLDVGGFGSNVLTPVLKNVPIINKILPDSTEPSEEDGASYSYKSLADAISYIKELEVQLANEQESVENLTGKNNELQKEVDRLKRFEENQEEFQTLKSKFYNEVVFGKDALDYENYIQYYQSIDPEHAEELLKEAADRYAYNQAYAEQADAYARMDPKAAAAVFVEMSGDLDIVVELLKCMKVADRAEVLAAISDTDANYAAKITKLIVP